VPDQATKKILRGVAFPDRVYRPGDEEALERRMTADHYRRLKDTDPPSLEGEWNPGGAGEPPMPGSRFDRSRAGAGPVDAAEHERVKRENARLTEELAAARAGKAAGGESGAVPAQAPGPTADAGAAQPGQPAGGHRAGGTRRNQ
jgi:hypothetical protein